ncbi:tudor domain-containing protein 1-like [Myxocyprinus asiaticus]|uniref:tudor domain-containing protein 1-like n=1 Tax=Myxocyprinus asiaticus TaxID=70543 RepID=UPI0022222EB2|nr:tudor domain-containing protein 1-like [Myxocyprinus asiaticus]
MNHAFNPTMIRPNLPLRRPATGPGSFTTRGPAPAVHELAQEQLLASDALEGSKDGVRKENNVISAKNSSEFGDFLSPPQTVEMVVGPLVKLCNYCSHQGNFRCTRCKKTCYCSVACQTEDWKAHRHVCKPSNSDVTGEKAKESKAVPCGNGLGVLQAKDNCIEVQPKRMYRRDLRQNDVSNGAAIQGTVIELRNPGKFFIHLQSVEMMESLKNISRELQKTYGTSYAAEYKPEIGELCAVKFSLDRNWYRAEVQSVDVARKSACVFYIDFGNEENVSLDDTMPLSAKIDAAPPFALQCCVARVTPLTGSWTGECTIAVKQLLVGKSLPFTVVDIMNDGALLAVDVPLSTLGKHLSTFLIDQGYAIKEDTPVKPQIEHDINSLLTASFENFKRLSGGKNENSEARPPEPLTQGVGDTFTAVVTHLQSPSEILCQKLENASVIQQLQVNLREHCLNTKVSENFRPAPGTVCCSLFSEDNQWYRAKVLAYSSEDRLCVGYIDFGNSEEVELNRLRPISMELLALPTQVIPCSLAGIKPSTGTWSEEATLMVKRLVCNRFIRVEILGKKDGKALVSMIDESSDPQTNVTELLLTMGYATAESEAENKDPAQESIPGMPSLCGPVIEKMEWTCAELPSDGRKVELVISILKSLDEFYCYNYSAADEQSLTELSYELMKHCVSEKAPFTPTVGEPCCALFTGDGQWYRAMVLEVCAERKARVYFVDYGNSCEVEAAHLKAISPSQLKLPFQAIRCWLEGVEPVEGQWNKEAVRRFQALCASQPLSGKVLSITEKGYGVELESSGKSIAAVLISEKLSRPYRRVKQPPPKLAERTSQIEALPTFKPIDRNPPAVELAKVNNKEAADTPAEGTISNAVFSLDWKTLELPCNETFQPRVAAVISPSLFYIMNPGKVNVEGLTAVMTDVEKYCSKQPARTQCHPLPGAACCAQFSGDKNWYRAVVLEVTSKHAHVIYADYGNMETVPVSNILPITKELLQHPFQIVRCALAGKKHFPSVWPTDVLELFGIQMSGGILASVQGFDGTFNLLTLAQQSGQSDRDINSIVLGALQKGPRKDNLKSPVQEKRDPDQRQTRTARSNKASDQTQSADVERPALEDQGPSLPSQNASNCKLEEPENATNAMTIVECTESQNITSSKSSSGSACLERHKAPTSCCCLELKQKIDHIEELVLLLMKSVGGTKQ